MIKISNFTKRYSKVLAVENVSFNVKRGTITGFIGRNGAGKSTTLRGMLGLTQMDNGLSKIDDVHYLDYKSPSQKIGVVLDASRLHPGRSGYNTLKVASILTGVKEERIKEVLHICGLTIEQSKRLVRTYSLGMKQRLCIAQALLASPSVLVLDEPVNGLDPQGIRWIRDTLKDFADKGGTVLLSSHLLSEVEKIADHIVMICDGKILIDKPLSNILLEWSNLEEAYLHYTDEAYIGSYHEIK